MKKDNISTAVVVTACILVISCASFMTPLQSLWLSRSDSVYDLHFSDAATNSSSNTETKETRILPDADRGQQQQQKQQQQHNYSWHESKARHFNICGSNTVGEDTTGSKSDNDEFEALCRSRFLLYAEYLLHDVGVGRLEIVQIGAHIAWDVNDVLTKGLMQYFESFLNSSITTTNKMSSRKFRWTFVEPSPTNYKGLVKNVQRHTNTSQQICQTLTVNAGIVPDTTPPNTTMTFYALDESIDPQTGYDSKSGKTLPVYITQLSGFSRHALEFNRGQFRKRGLNMDDYIKPINVTTLTFTQLMNDYGLGGSDGSISAGLEEGSAAAVAPERPWLMLIDTEGFDCNIIQGIDEYSPHWPYFLIFEKHQCGPSKDLAFAYLKKIGYDIVYSAGQNAVAVLNDTKNIPMSYNL